MLEQEEPLFLRDGHNDQFVTIIEREREMLSLRAARKLRRRIYREGSFPTKPTEPSDPQNPQQ
jgi:hypothetical protein